ncbi:MAG: ABC transporter permease [Cellvibrionaceae bacterium]|nr:ABC transporter permease [Cellvibrionaceae bacterium]
MAFLQFLLAPFSSLLTNRELIYSFSVREVESRYRGSWLGFLWGLVTPILLLLVYMFVFGVIFKARWPQVNGVDQNFAALLFCGIITYTMFSELLTKAPSVILENANYVKKVIFPLETLAWPALFNTLFHFALSGLVLLVFIIFWGNGLSWTILLLPLLLLVYVLQLLGIVWFVSALGVYMRDVNYVAGFIATALFFLSPVFFPKSAVPESFARIMEINPLSYYIESVRLLVVLDDVPQSSDTLQAVGLALVSFYFGYWFFNKVKRGFADLL